MSFLHPHSSELTRYAWIDDALIPIVLVLTIIFGLYVDYRVPAWGQSAVDLFVWILYLLLLLRADFPRRVALIMCLGIATAGECFASLVWGLYTYRLHNIPLFVPPGHALLYTVGVAAARWMPSSFIRIVPTVTLPYILAGAIFGLATFDVALFAIFLLCLSLGRAKKLYATMFVLSLALEVYGTALGNWRWWPSIKWLGLSTLNPPIAAGALYCLLDLLVMGCLLTLRRPNAPSLPEVGR